MSALAATGHVPDRPTLTVDLGAVAANTRTLAAHTRGAVMAVVKADGFGHGAVDVARAALAGGASRLGVTSIEEALPLREAGLDVPLLSWLNPLGADVEEAVRHGVELAVPDLAHLAEQPPGARVHLHVDCGMARDGCPPDEWDRLCRAARAAERGGRLRVVGVMGHLGCAADPSDPHNDAGLATFRWALARATRAGLRPGVRHLAATAATLALPQTHFDASRIGAGLVGIDPSGTTALREALTLTAPVVAVRDVAPGTAVGYDHAHVTSVPTRLALVPVGYGDGLPRAASGAAEVLLRGRRRPVVGRLSMDQLVVDAGDAGVRAGERVTVFGPGDAGEPTVHEWAGWAATLPHEVVTGLGARLHRRVLPLRHLAPVGSHV